MKSREEYKFEDVADFLHQNLTLIIRGSKCSEDRAHYIYDCFKETATPIMSIDYDLATKIYSVFYTAGGITTTKRVQWVNPKFCVNAKLWCKIEQKYFKAGAAQAAAAFSTKITALRGDVKGRGVSLRSSRLLTFRLQPVSPACGRQRTPLTVRELRSSPAAFRSTSS